MLFSNNYELTFIFETFSKYCLLSREYCTLKVLKMFDRNEISFVSIVLFISSFISGRPMPQVRWFWSGLPLSSTSEVSSGSTVTSNVILSDLKRSDNGVLLTCQAQNNNVSSPVKHSVAIRMNCKYLLLTLILFQLI